MSEGISSQFTPAIYEGIVAERDELKRQVEAFRSAQHVICSWCGNKTERGSMTDEELGRATNNHVMNCDKRPERALLNLVYALSVSLGVDLDKFPANDPGAVVEAFEAAINKIRFP